MFKNNPVTYFEIPVKNIDRASKFYKNVFGFEFELQKIDGNEMSLFPFEQKAFGASGALAKGESYNPSKDGSILYFNVDNIVDILAKIVNNGGDVYYPKTSIGENSYVAEFIDIEGNRIALLQN
jgi:uncharacterized protein